MNPIRPYSLSFDEQSSSDYYKGIAAFTDGWQPHARQISAHWTNDFLAFQRRRALPLRSADECALEILTIGVLLREHGEEAANLSGRSAWLLSRLVRLQERAPWAEQPVKALRGLIGGLRHIWRAARGRLYSDVWALRRLIVWLNALGETTQAARLAEWLRFLESLPSTRARSALRIAMDLARDFSAQSDAALGAYTRDVDRYRERVIPAARWRYDLNLVSRSRVEYHLGMLGTETLNRAFHAGFAASPRRLVIVPPCLRARPAGECRAVETPLGAQCQGCTPGCRVFQATQLGRRHGVMVVSIPDDALSQLCVASGQAGSGLGVIGVACALRNWTAGWEAQRLGLHAQGLLLDYPGCKKHWYQEDVATDLNLAELEKMLQEAENDHIP